MPTTVPEFYHTQVGAICAALLRERLQWFWPDLRNQKVLGLGYATPFLGAWRGRGAACYSALMPECVAQADLGVAGMESARCVYADATHLPFQDEMFDRIVLVHALRTEEQAVTLLRGAGRVLRDDGRMIVISPTVFAGRLRQRKTPFAQDAAFAPAQFRRILQQAMLHTERRDEALFFPVEWGYGRLRTGRSLDIAGKVLAPGLGSLSLIEVVKTLYSPRLLPVTPWWQLRRRQAIRAELHADLPSGTGAGVKAQVLSKPFSC